MHAALSRLQDPTATQTPMAFFGSNRNANFQSPLKTPPEPEWPLRAEWVSLLSPQMRMRLVLEALRLGLQTELEATKRGASNYGSFLLGAHLS